MPRPGQHAHCSYCGAPYPPGAGWPRRCVACGVPTYRNPLPVAVALVGVRDGDRLGVLAIRRGIPPKRGALALPGGFIDHGEDWRVAAAREVDEETGLGLPPDAYGLFDVASADDGHLLVFARLVTPIDAEALPAFTPTDETTERTVLYAPTSLAFDLHERALAAFLASV
jgi:ADP-ribose pyrophosphatase YjhB (NUDIX family)